MAQMIVMAFANLGNFAVARLALDRLDSLYCACGLVPRLMMEMTRRQRIVGVIGSNAKHRRLPQQGY